MSDLPAAEILLTPREVDVLQLLSTGARNKAIAGALSLTEDTVKVYMSRLLRKTGTSSRLELALLALGHGSTVLRRRCGKSGCGRLIPAPFTERCPQHQDSGDGG